jgi:hypothetical protein
MSATSKWGQARQHASTYAKLENDWAIITEFSVPSPDRFIRDITTFLPDNDGSWRRDSERHENVLIDVSQIPALLAEHGINAKVSSDFGAETLPEGLFAVTGQRPA